MTRSYQATHNLIAVSANNRESAINTEQTLDTCMLAEMGDVIDLDPRREANDDEASGYEEADVIYNLGNLSNAKFNFSKAQPQHFAFLTGYGLGSVSSAVAGAGYEHTIAPIDGDLDADRSVPSFTAAQRYGKTVMKRRFASMFVDAFQATFARDEFCKITGDIKGTGKVSDNIEHESITAAPNATSLTLAANAVEGSSAAERLQNVQRIIVELASGVWTEVSYTAVSDATPAVISIAATGEAGDNVTYKVLYIPAESGWMTFPARVTESPLRVSQMTLKVGGKWNGSAFQGGRELQAELKSLEWSFNNNLKIQFVPGGGDAYASRAIREGRLQTIALNREMREYIMQQHLDDNDEFGVYILAEGAVIDESHNYQVEIIFPSCGLLKAPISVDEKRLAEAGDLRVLEDPTYGSVIAKVKNLQSTYAYEA
ncbi:MAG: hypothetical protein JW884_14260 [Deltaproteobacteria bacterium]|nr:hypothetical protein [Deltaproteobacteria bacterium]